MCSSLQYWIMFNINTRYTQIGYKNLNLNELFSHSINGNWTKVCCHFTIETSGLSLYFKVFKTFSDDWCFLYNLFKLQLSKFISLWEKISSWKIDSHVWTSKETRRILLDGVDHYQLFFLISRTSKRFHYSTIVWRVFSRDKSHVLPKSTLYSFVSRNVN